MKSTVLSQGEISIVAETLTPLFIPLSRGAQRPDPCPSTRAHEVRGAGRIGGGGDLDESGHRLVVAVPRDAGDVLGISRVKRRNQGM